MREVVNYRRFFWALGILTAVFLVLFLVIGNQRRGQEEQENALRVTLNRIEEENREMDARLQLVDTEDYIVSSAMNNYAFMNKNDLRFKFTNPEALYAYTEEELKILMDEMAD